MTFKEVCKLMAADGFVLDDVLDAANYLPAVFAFVNKTTQQRCIVHDDEGNWALYTFDRNLKKEPQ